MSTSGMQRQCVPLPGWSELPEDLLVLVLEKSTCLSDFIRFRSVCEEWRSLAKPGGLPPQLPLLMLPYNPFDDVRSFFCPATEKSFDVSLPELVGKAVLASYFGWMVLLDIDTKALSLLHPIRRAKIELPPSSGFHQLLDLHLDASGNGLRGGGHEGIPLAAMEFGTMCRWEVSLSSSPSSAAEDCFVVVSDACKVHFCKLGDISWSSVSHHGCRSAVYHDGRLYIMRPDAEMTVFDTGTLAKLKTIPSPIRSENTHRYFISLAKNNWSELVMFAGNPNIVYERDPFEILRIDLSEAEEKFEWSSIGNLPEMAFYWSMKQCIVLHGGGNFPASTMGRIYFDGAPYEHDDEKTCHQLSISGIKDGDCKVLCCGVEKPSMKLMKPAWVNT